MDLRTFRRRRLLAAVVAVVSSFVLTTQLVNPSPVMVSIDGNTTEISEIAGVFTYQDVLVLAGAAFLLGISGTYLVVERRTVTETTDEEVDTESRSPPTRPTSTFTAGGAAVMSRADAEPAEARLDEWEATAERLANNEREVYEAVLEAEGVRPQSEIVEQTEFSKATVSRTLDNLESKNLVERKRRGMGNVIVLL
ncbi:helix-turn-helix transcriptional regulator [Halorussus pelagicus]|uniref:helix-turn-helix transcriptional regulator n=1 Tax=Halorussus pelagicus TaxID=2505977 RepID=UPI000FFBD3B0|nr:MarR family transcriptional regulator [Halorussus pelagicus]